jgi:tetratricopeptide (TPR) repeat protein
MNSGNKALLGIAYSGGRMIRRFSFCLLACLILPPSSARAAWHEATSRHFIIYSEQNPEELKRYAERLERFDQAVRVARGIKDPPLNDAGKLTVFVLRNGDAVEGLIGARGSGIAGLYVAKAAGPVALVNRERASSKFDLGSEAVFFHEYLHHLMLQQLDMALPSWVVEGFAEFFATARVEENGSVTLGYVPEYRSVALFNLRGLTLEEMLGASDRHIDSEEWELTYGKGWLLAHYLTFEKSRRNQLGRYMTGIQKGEAPIDAARTAFGDLKQLNKELEAYLREKRHSGIVIPAEKLAPGAIAVRPLTAAEDAIMRVRMKSSLGFGKRYLGRIATEARDVAGNYPNSAQVFVALAKAELDVEHYDQALGAANRALAIAPAQRKGMIYKGQALMELGRKDPEKANWKDIRSWFTKANRSDPDDAEPLMLFYESFVAEGVPASRNSVEGLAYAHALVPQDKDLRMLLVRELVRAGSFEAAVRIYGPIAYDPHAGDEREKRIEVVAKLKAKDGGAALTLLDGIAEKRKKDE